jgi:hypothetical protein
MDRARISTRQGRIVIGLSKPKSIAPVQTVHASELDQFEGCRLYPLQKSIDLFEGYGLYRLQKNSTKGLCKKNTALAGPIRSAE